MSMLLMVKAMSRKVGNPLRKLVFIKLADNANDQGECWPSVPHIAEECEMSERSVQNHIKQLVKQGFVSVATRKTNSGLNQSNIYYLNLNKPTDGEGENAAPYGASPAPSGANTAGVSGANAAPRTSHSSEPVKEPKTLLTPQGEKPSRKSKFDPLTAKPENVSAEVWADWVKFRQEIKKPLTETSCRQQAKMLATCSNADQVIMTSIVNSWQGLFPEKIQQERQSRPNTHTGFEHKHYESMDSYWSKNIEQGDPS
ncbi:helix-turn-helix domain-containing protein [Xenorhabdus bovienii]|nr:helix-turn-helix domain-containing protein [Xenorhabdus bovienii]